MRNRTCAQLVCVLLFSIGLAATQTPADSQQPAFEGPRLRIGVTAVEIDAVVTDKSGHHVTDLRTEDFQILQDGRPQKVMSAQYIPLDPPAEKTAAPPPTVHAAGSPSPASGPPAPMPRPEDVRHTLAVIVDDLNLSFISAARVRSALQRFIERDIHAGDLVAIVRTGRGVGRFQPFTSDKRMLIAATSRLRYNVMQAMRLNDEFTQHATAMSGEQDFTRDVLTAGSLGAASFVIRGMREMPGRKSVLLITDGWSLTTRTPDGDGDDRRGFDMLQPRINEAMRRLLDEANRSFVVIYAIDARGLVPPDLHIDRSGQPPNPFQASEERRRIFDSQGGPQLLTDMAGGLFFKNTNDLPGAMSRVMADQRGYYLIGYQPDDETFKKDNGRARFHAVKVKVARPNVNVRARAGFFGVPDEDTAPKTPVTREARMLAALHRPFAATDVGLQATSLFWRDASYGSFVRALVHVDARTLTFKPDGPGKLAAPIELAAALIDERGAIAVNKLITGTLRSEDPVPPDVLARGLVYNVDLAVKEPGPYQLRVAVNDVNADGRRLGSANEFVLVPRSDGNQFGISGVLLEGAGAGAQPGAGASSPSPSPSLATPASASARAQEDTTESPAQTNAAVRRFVPGMAVSYTFQVYNVRRDEGTGKAAIASHFRLFRDGRLVGDGDLDPTSTPLSPTEHDFTVAGTMQLPQRLLPGAYDLEIAVTDTGARQNTATQWTSFTIGAPDSQE